MGCSFEMESGVGNSVDGGEGEGLLAVGVGGRASGCTVCKTFLFLFFDCALRFFLLFGPGIGRCIKRDRHTVCVQKLSYLDSGQIKIGRDLSCIRQTDLLDTELNFPPLFLRPLPAFQVPDLFHGSNHRTCPGDWTSFSTPFLCSRFLMTPDS